MLANAAHADAAEAAVRDLHFELVDLDPNDGIAPSFTFQNLAGNTIIDHAPDWTSTNYRLHEGRDGYSVIRQFASFTDIHSGGQVVERTVDLADAYDNGGSMSINLSFVTYAHSSLTASAVPEPGTWGLGLAGLMVVGTALRGASRRRQTLAKAR